MKTSIENYIRENRELLDVDEPSPDTWANIEAALDPPAEKKRGAGWWMKIAACAILLVGAGIWIGIGMQGGDEPELIAGLDNAEQDVLESPSRDEITKLDSLAVVNNLKSELITDEKIKSLETGLPPSPPVNYSWETGGETRDKLIAGNYEVTVTDHNGCADGSALIVAGTNAQGTGINNPNYGVSDGAATTTFITVTDRQQSGRLVPAQDQAGQFQQGYLVNQPNGGSPGYTYSWTTERFEEGRNTNAYGWDFGDGDKRDKWSNDIAAGEYYAPIQENHFIQSETEATSTFSIDVDRASYSNTRRFISSNELPPADAVRIEEFLNYFHYDYKAPTVDGERPFAVETELGICPWNRENYLLHIGLQGQEIPKENLPANNLVFLIDVSGSMDDPAKLALLKKGFGLLVDELRPEDRVSIVVYAGAAGEVLPSTPGTEKDKIMDAIEKLSAGGSTAGGEGIELAYKIAQQNFMENGNNRVVLATDGDFNVGVSSEDELVRLIERKRESGVFLSVMGFGTGNYQDAKMEQLADNGNGNMAYIDNIMEARKVLVTEMGGTLTTIAKDVKLQVVFNQNYVQSYRLIGYENRLLAKEDFDDDIKDAGELGSGHTVTAIYEIVPAGGSTNFRSSIVTSSTVTMGEGQFNDGLAEVKFRYIAPNEDHSTLITETVSAVPTGQPSENFNWSAAVASFGMLLRHSAYKGNASYDSVIALAKKAKGADVEGYRAEFIRMVEQAKNIAQPR